ncbi:hypothetical protein RJ641_030166 [Dillenia turbinata]|uniref:Uncharacterized protein n=1 Tax=Dillenia turbinata TaxID=194707 RepID=A0AAN8ZNS9_9MAGN
MSLLETFVTSKPLTFSPRVYSYPSSFSNSWSSSNSKFMFSAIMNHDCIQRAFLCLSVSGDGNMEENYGETFPTAIPRKPRRGRTSEAVAVEDFVRDSLERTFASIRQQSPELFIDNDTEGNEDNAQKKKKMVVEEDNPDWPLDADECGGRRYGAEIDWEGEIDDAWIKEINCLEWEGFAFHPSPLIVLVLERYKRASDNWKVLKELEKAVKVYWSAKNRLPPRAVKLDINIERDLGYAFRAKECSQILFLRGSTSIVQGERVSNSQLVGSNDCTFLLQSEETIMG